LKPIVYVYNLDKHSGTPPWLFGCMLRTTEPSVFVSRDVTGIHMHCTYGPL
jgi:hypothetical protein